MRDWSTTGADWSSASRLKGRFLLQCSSCSSPFFKRDWSNWSGADGPRENFFRVPRARAFKVEMMTNKGACLHVGSFLDGGAKERGRSK